MKEKFNSKLVKYLIFALIAYVEGRLLDFIGRIIVSLLHGDGIVTVVVIAIIESAYIAWVKFNASKNELVILTKFVVGFDLMLPIFYYYTLAEGNWDVANAGASLMLFITAMVLGIIKMTKAIKR